MKLGDGMFKVQDSKGGTIGETDSKTEALNAAADAVRNGKAREVFVWQKIQTYRAKPVEFDVEVTE